MESSADSGSAPASSVHQQHHHQQLVLSAEDAAQLLAQAGIQLGDHEQVIIGDMGGADHDGGGGIEAGGGEHVLSDQEQVGRLHLVRLLKADRVDSMYIGHVRVFHA